MYHMIVRNQRIKKPRAKRNERKKADSEMEWRERPLTRISRNKREKTKWT